MGGVGSWGWSALEAAGLMPSVGGGATYIDKVLGYSPIAYWPLNEASGTDAFCEVDSDQDGTHSGVTLGQTGIGDGETCPSYDGVNDLTNVYTATLASAFNGSELTVACWFKVSGSGVWTDATDRKLVAFLASGSDQVLIHRVTTDTRLQWAYAAGGAWKTRGVSGLTATDWQHAAMTVSKTADVMQAYLNGVAQGGAFNSLGTWTTDPLLSNRALIGANTVTSQTWDGYLAHVAIWDSALSAADIADLATVV